MFNWVLGPPGNGKSLFLMKQLEWELAHSKRNIVTNLAVLMSELQGYMNRTYPSALIDVWQRVRILTQDETYFFWRYRGYDEAGNDVVWKPETFTETVNGMSVTKIIWPEAGANDPGVVAILDEMQEIYDQQTWASFAREGRSALSQHRKFRLDAWLASPYLEQIAKPLREISQSYYYLRNSAYESIGYGKLNFRYATRFFYNVFRRPMKSDLDKPYTGGVFSLDVKGIASCYNTAAGVGVENRIADQDLKRAGFPAWAKWPALAAAILIGFFCVRAAVAIVPKGLHAIGNIGASAIRVNQKSPPSSVSQKVLRPATSNFERAPVFARPSMRRDFMPIERPQVFVRWSSQVGGVLRFGLSDGRVLVNPTAIWDGNNLQLPTGERLPYQPISQQPSGQSEPSFGRPKFSWQRAQP